MEKLLEFQVQPVVVDTTEDWLCWEQILSPDPRLGFAFSRHCSFAMSSDPWHPAADKKSFMQLADLLNIQVVTLRIRRHPLARWAPALYGSTPSRLLRGAVRHRWVWRGTAGSGRAQGSPGCADCGQATLRGSATAPAFVTMEEPACCLSQALLTSGGARCLATSDLLLPQ